MSTYHLLNRVRLFPTRFEICKGPVRLEVTRLSAPFSCRWTPCRAPGRFIVHTSQTASQTASQTPPLDHAYCAHHFFRGLGQGYSVVCDA